MVDMTITMQIYPNKISIEERNHKEMVYSIPDDGCTLDSAVKCFSDYVYTNLSNVVHAYLNGVDSNV